MIYGMVLAGGRSSRFGREKPAVEIDGRPMMAHIAERIRPHVAALAINAPPECWAARFAMDQGLPLLPDASGDPGGPLSGVKAGLIWAATAGAEFLISTPCDTPFLPEDLIPALAARITAEAGAATVRTTEGLQPLCTLWRCDRLQQVHDALSHGDHPATHKLLAELGAVEAIFDAAQAFENINSLQDYACLISSAATPPTA